MKTRKFIFICLITMASLLMFSCDILSGVLGIETELEIVNKSNDCLIIQMGKKTAENLSPTMYYISAGKSYTVKFLSTSDKVPYVCKPIIGGKTPTGTGEVKPNSNINGEVKYKIPPDYYKKGKVVFNGYSTYTNKDLSN